MGERERRGGEGGWGGGHTNMQTVGTVHLSRQWNFKGYEKKTLSENLWNLYNCPTKPNNTKNLPHHHEKFLFFETKTGMFAL